MNIFAWLEPVLASLEAMGETRLARQIEKLPTHVVDDEHDVVDAIVPELLAGVRRLKHPWLEVYVRHWWLQSRILRRSEVRGGLDEAVALLELSHREETRECPQSVCAVQDLVAGYGMADGPGYAPERLEVSLETLARIDPSWPCFSCISAEHASALRDAGRPEEALAFLDAQDRAASSAGAPLPDTTDSRAATLLDLGRVDEALRILKEPPPPESGNNGRAARLAARALAFARAHRPDEALEALPDFATEIFPSAALHLDWLEAVEALVALEALPNDGRLDRQVAAIAARLEGLGAMRRALEANEARARLALARGSVETAEDALGAMRRVADELARPLDAPARTESMALRLAEAAASAGPMALGADPDATLASLPEDPERALRVILAATDRWPSHLGLLEALVSRIYDRPSAERARTRLARAASMADSPRDILHLEGSVLLRYAPPEALEAWAEAGLRAGPDHQAAARWALGRRAREQGLWEEARAHIEALLEIVPDAKNARRMLANVLESAGDLEGALARLDELERLGDDRASLVWDRLVLATKLERWDVVRRLGQRLGMVFETEEGPVDEAWHLIRLVFRPPVIPAGTEVVTAVRTGPVTARVLSIAMPDGLQLHGDEVIFDPAPENDPAGEPAEDEAEDTGEPPSKEAVDAEHEEAEEAGGSTEVAEGSSSGEPERLLVFRALSVLRPGRRWSFFTMGARPDDEALDRARADLRSLGGASAVVSDDDWVISDGERELPGIVLLVALPETFEGPSVAGVLGTLAGACPGPLTWLGLLERLGDVDQLAAQRAVAAAWALE